MSSRKSAASRANGAKSHGPVTPEGKARSSQNSSTHGIFTSPFLLRNENNAEFLKLEAGLIEEWDPQGPTETVPRRADARLPVAPQPHLAGRGRRHRPADGRGRRGTRPRLQEFDENCRVATAFKHLADNSKFLDLMQRYDRSLSRQFDRALVRLRNCSATVPAKPEPVNRMQRNCKTSTRPRSRQK